MTYYVKLCSKCKAKNPPHMTYCAKCGATLPVIKQESDTPPIDPPAYAAAPEPEAEPTTTTDPSGQRIAQQRIGIAPEIVECRIVDVDLPFWSMVNFMVKWAVAAIPAFIILIILGAFAVAVLSAIGVSLGR